MKLLMTIRLRICAPSALATLPQHCARALEIQQPHHLTLLRHCLQQLPLPAVQLCPRARFRPCPSQPHRRPRQLGHRRAHPRCPAFSKISTLVYFLYNVTVQRTFQNVCLPRPRRRRARSKPRGTGMRARSLPTRTHSAAATPAGRPPSGDAPPPLVSHTFLLAEFARPSEIR